MHGRPSALRARGARVGLLAAAIAVASLTFPVRADTATLLLDGHLPHPVFAQAAAWTGAHVYLFGGAEMVCYCELDEIVRYDPATKEAVVLPQRLPGPHSWPAAVWDGSRAHVFARQAIIHFDPATGTVTQTATNASFFMSSAVWTGTHAYVFGGAGSGGGKIYRYDPATDTLTLRAATLPARTIGASAVWTGTHAYLFGGTDWWSFSDRILRYDPVADSVTVLASVLPHAASTTSAAWSGSRALVFGGYDSAGARNDITIFDPATGLATASDVVLPQSTSDTSAAWIGSSAYVFGGMCAACVSTSPPLLGADPVQSGAAVVQLPLETDAIVRFTPGAGPIPPT